MLCDNFEGVGWGGRREDGSRGTGHMRSPTEKELAFTHWPRPENTHDHYNNIVIYILRQAKHLMPLSLPLFLALTLEKPKLQSQGE